MAGICVAIGREFVQDMSTGGAWGYMWIAVLLLAYIPFAALTVYLEVVYRRRYGRADHLSAGGRGGSFVTIMHGDTCLSAGRCWTHSTSRCCSPPSR